MSSFLWPDQHTRWLFNHGRTDANGNPWTDETKRKIYERHQVKQKQKHESMIARAQRLTSERMTKEERVVEQVTIYQKLKSKVSNFLKSFLS